MVLGLNVLHVLTAWRHTLGHVERLLKPGGVFISSTMCIGDAMPWFGAVARIGRFLRVLPALSVFTSRDLEEAIGHAGFIIEHRWQPDRRKAVFIVAQKPARA